jgi:hypothetical protein
MIRVIFTSHSFARLPTIPGQGSGSIGHHLSPSSARRMVIGWTGWA